jgi:hypothetical protein
MISNMFYGFIYFEIKKYCHGMWLWKLIKKCLKQRDFPKWLQHITTISSQFYSQLSVSDEKQISETLWNFPGWVFWVSRIISKILDFNLISFVNILIQILSYRFDYIVNFKNYLEIQ